MTVGSHGRSATVEAIEQGAPPRHLGIIIDGNRRWAQERGMPTLEGHRRGYELVVEIALAALERGVAILSAYLFSTENWRRSTAEVEYLMGELERVATRGVEELHAHGVRARFLGRRQSLPVGLARAIERAEELTSWNDRGTVALCVDYGGQSEIAEAASRIVASGVPARAVTPERIAAELYAPDLPPVDLLIRTGGERRLSNFMLWRTAYAELRFVDKMWPAFTSEDLDDALADFATRTRRFGR